VKGTALLVTALLCVATSALARHIVVIGDSVAHGAGDETGLGIAGQLRSILNANVVNYGINGARTFNVLRLLRTTSMNADSIVMSIGGNDLYGDSLSRLLTLVWPQRAMSRVAARVAAVVRRIATMNPSAHIVLLGVYDPYQRRALDRLVNEWDAALIKKFAADSRVSVIRIADLFRSATRISPLDHFHPSAAGYALIAARIAPSL
jgi:lysophospholipase L1-like esterase